jgi:hypothetical protein
LVLSLELSAAIPHTCATEFPSMVQLWESMLHAEPELAVRFQKALQPNRPELAEEIGTTLRSTPVSRNLDKLTTLTSPIATISPTLTQRRSNRYCSVIVDRKHDSFILVHASNTMVKTGQLLLRSPLSTRTKRWRWMMMRYSS